MTTFGTLRYSRGRWIIECEPHVRLRFRRVFEGVSKSEHAALTLTETNEHALELRWFLHRFPLTMTHADRDRLKRAAKAHERDEDTIAAMLSEDFAPRDFVGMAIPPRPYQAVAAELALETGELLVADDLGVGKTCTAITALTDPKMRPAVVVTLAHIVPQWVAELQKFTPDLTVHALRKGTPYPIAPLPDVIVTSYHKLTGWADELAGKVRGVVFDEAQELRRIGKHEQDLSQKYAAAEHVARSARVRIGCTGTPVYNYGNEMFNIFRVLAPGKLGSRAEFGREWCGGDAVQIKDPQAFGKYLRRAGLMLRRTRRDVARELPALTRIPHTVDVDMQALSAVETTAIGLAETILASNVADRGVKFTAAQELSNILRLATGKAKARHVAAFVRMLVESGERVLLAGWHHQVYDAWREELADLRPAFYTGHESVPQKEEAKQRFLDRDTDLLVMSLRAGAGVDGLQHVCRTVVIGELDWSPAVHHQFIGRIHRDGQTDPVMAYFLLASDGADPVIADVLGIKRQQAEGISDPDADIVEQLQVDPHHIRRLAERYLAERPRSKEVA